MDVAAPSTAAGSRSARPRLSPTTALLLAIWLGLAAGYLDVGIIVAKRFTVNTEGAYRTARDFPWTVPVGHAALALAPAAALALVGLRRPGRRLSLRFSAWLLATLVFWGAFLRAPLYPWACLLVAAGVGRLFADAVADSGFGLRVGWVRKSLAGMVVLLPLLAAGTTGARALRESRAIAGLPPAASTRNVLFIVWDTVRASSLSLYGYNRPTSPNLEKWAAQGVCYKQAIAPSPWTYPSHSSFFTGRWPYAINAQWKFTLDAPGPTLAEHLSARGYQTAGFSANTNCCSYENGLDRGFARFEDYALTPRLLLARTVPGKWLLERFLTFRNPYERKWIALQSRGAAEVDDAFLGWLDRRRPDRPFFAFLNYFDAHEPYIPSFEFPLRFGVQPASVRDFQLLFAYDAADKDQFNRHDFVMARDCYDDCIAFLDDRLGRLLGELDRRRILDDTVVVITSDHGEAFAEHGYCGHAMAVDIEQVGVPLVILAPGEPKGRTVWDPVSLRDLGATITDLLGLAEDAPFPGRTLADYWRSPPDRPPSRRASPVLSERADELIFAPGRDESLVGQRFQLSVVAPDGVQYIRTGTGEEKIYNLLKDPAARRNLAGTPEGDAMVGRLRKALLDALQEERGTSEVEAAYLAEYRRGLANLVRDGEARAIAGRP
jgi:arylsulfatase A-like enzyme